jgi:hypothetical protein
MPTLPALRGHKRGRVGNSSPALMAFSHLSSDPPVPPGREAFQESAAAVQGLECALARARANPARKPRSIARR